MNQQNSIKIQKQNKDLQKGLIIPLNADEKLIYNGKAQRELYKRYGDPRVAGWGNKWMVLWYVRKEFLWFPTEKMYIHKEFKEKLSMAFSFMEMADLHHEIKSFDGCYNLRTVRGASTLLSIHSWGCAIDLNAHLNPLGGSCDWSHDFISMMEHCGISCGARWHGRPDPMHFALVNG